MSAATMTCKDFWELPEVVAQQDIQKRNPWGSDEHRNADDAMKAILADKMGQAFADDYWSEYD